MINRVRTILVLGYWVLGNIHRYWVVLLLGDIFCCSDIQYDTDQTAVGTIHIHASERLFSSAFDLYSESLTDAIVSLNSILISYCLLNTIIVIIIEFWEFSWLLLYYTLVSDRYWYWVLVSLEANIIGYWILGAFLGIILTLVETIYYTGSPKPNALIDGKLISIMFSL